MSYKTTLVKMLLNKTPTKMVLWAANKKLKGVAELIDFSFDSEERTLYAEMVLQGEDEPINVLLEEFSVITHEERYLLLIHKVQSNRPWLDGFLNKVILEREWKIPDSQIELVQELFDSDNSDQEEN
ncbi:MAG: hypothetical protein KAH20_00775 [Methylococcales bacterium]|nr:hypothetical protein [Methylococcales bacterium]